MPTTKLAKRTLASSRSCLLINHIIIFLFVRHAYAWNFSSGDGQTYVGISTVDADRQTPARLKDRLPFGGARGEVFSGGSGGEPPGIDR